MMHLLESEADATAPDSAEGDSGSDEDEDDITERFKIELRKLFWRYLMPTQLSL